MGTYVVKLSLLELAKAYRAMGTKTGKIIEKAAMKTAMYGQQQAIISTDSAPPGNPSGEGYGAVNTGIYRRAWKWRRITNGAVISNSVPYASVIEDGRRRGKGVSRQGQVALARWAIRKGLVQGKGKKRDAAARNVAFLIARALKKRGLKGRKVMGRIVHEIAAMWAAELADGVLMAARGGK